MARPLVLLIRDGWGIGPDYPGNAVQAARKPNMDRILAQYPHCVLDASGEPVGVRAGSQGSSEVGHLNMGAGRVVEQEILRVDNMIRTGELFRIPRLVEAVKLVKANGTAFHLMGLVQDQGVHAISEHLFALLEFLGKQGVSKVFIHYFADGRDTAPRSALTYLQQLEGVIAKCKCGRIASVMGRYWSMDRAKNWARTEKAYRAMLYGEGLVAASARQAIEDAYKRADQQAAKGENLVENDEFILPTLIAGADGKPVGLIRDGDAVLNFNYRQDRAGQITKAFVEPEFKGFSRGPAPKVFYMGMTRYYDEFRYELVGPMNMANLLGEVLSRGGLMQLRVAEQQKYPHVTSFFNGKTLEPFVGEDRIEVESIKVPEDQQPQMSAYPVTDIVVMAVTEGIAAVRAKAPAVAGVKVRPSDFTPPDAARLKDTYDVIVLNYANGDMVGHTGVFSATVKAIETVDECLGKVVAAVLARDGTVLITSDHGNAEEKLDRVTGQVATAHTTNPVEFVLVSNTAAKSRLIPHGKLSDIAPTMLKLLGVSVPKEMTAQSLIE
jgi:2,3-bisphosphoglycerate-independent phosphoglycerate mutase